MNIPQMLGPETSAQSSFQPGDRDGFRPRLPGQESHHHSVVDSGSLGDAADAARSDHPTKVQYQESNELSVDDIAGLVRPLRTARRRSGRRVATHAPSVVRLACACTANALPHTTVSGDSYGVQYHRQTRRLATRRAPRVTPTAGACTTSARPEDRR